MNNNISAQDYVRRVPVVVLVIGLLALPFCFIQANLTGLQSSPLLLLLFGVAALATVGLLAYRIVFRHLPTEVRRSPFLVFFAVFAFAAVIDLLISLTLMGGLIDSYDQTDASTENYDVKYGGLSLTYLF